MLARPLTDKVSARRANPSTKTHPLDGKPRVLIVEEDEASRKMLKRWLELNRYDVIDTADPEQSASLAEQLRPDLILIDVSLPDLAGLRAFQEMCQIPLLSEVPIILTSGCNTPAFLVEVWAAGCQEIHIKPLDLDELCRSVQHRLAKPIYKQAAA